MTIEDREKAADFPVGERWAENGSPLAVVTLNAATTTKPAVRIAGYERGFAVQSGNSVWETDQRGAFRPVPA